MFITELFTITKMQKQTKCPSIGEWIKKMLLNHKKKKKEKKRKFDICNNMDGSRGYAQ